MARIPAILNPTGQPHRPLDARIAAIINDNAGSQATEPARLSRRRPAKDDVAPDTAAAENSVPRVAGVP